MVKTRMTGRKPRQSRKNSRDIIVSVIGGVVQKVEHIPPGVRVLVHDYDTDDTSENKLDGNDKTGRYTEIAWGGAN